MSKDEYVQLNKEVLGSWLTVNRICNFRCKWCYAEGTRYTSEDSMSLELARNLIDFQAEIGVKEVLLIGGEPTLWKYLFEALDLISQRGMKSTMITNGVLLANENFLEKLSLSGIGNIVISLKSGNERQHEKTTGTSKFNEVKKALRNINKLGLKASCSITVNSLLLNNLQEILEVAAENGAQLMGLNFCTTTFQDGVPQKGFMPDPRDIVEKVVENFDEMVKTMNGNISISQSLPLCLWPQSFLEELERQNIITYGCHIQKRNGLIFDSKGNVLVCSCLYDFPIGTFGKDFKNASSFKEFWLSEEVADIYDRIITYPSKSCIECSKYKICGGGCPLHWFVNKPEHIIPQLNMEL